MLPNFDEGVACVNIQEVLNAKTKRDILKIEMSSMYRFSDKTRTNNRRKHLGVPMRRYSQYIKLWSKRQKGKEL